MSLKSASKVIILSFEFLAENNLSVFIIGWSIIFESEVSQLILLNLIGCLFQDDFKL